MLAQYDKTGEFGALDEALVKYIDQRLGGTVDDRYAKSQGRIKVMLTPYTDVVTHWAKDSIKTVYDKDLFKGVSKESFQPNAPNQYEQLVRRIRGVGQRERHYGRNFGGPFWTADEGNQSRDRCDRQPVPDRTGPAGCDNISNHNQSIKIQTRPRKDSGP